MQQRRLYDTIPETLNSYKVIGMSTPNSWDLKCKMLSSFNDEETAIIVFDAFRCSSTLLACFSSGIVGAMVMEKGLDSGTTIEEALKFSKSKNLELIYGGELHGNPVAGGIVGNSPFGACNKSDLNNKLLHFQSTNFGKAFVELIKYTTTRKAKTDVFVISFQNTEVTAELIIKSNYKKIYIVCASFYDCIALEDMILGGFLISSLKVELENLDDEALTMYACYKTFKDKKIFLKVVGQEVFSKGYLSRKISMTLLN